MEDYYKILGLEKSASADEIKKAYRNLAFKYHPDRNPGDKAAEETFKKINEAYSVLGDESKKKQYDMYGSSSSYTQNSAYGSYSATGTYGDSGYTNPFEEFFRYANYAGNRSASEKDDGYETYTWTKRSYQPTYTRSDCLRMLARGIGQSALAFFGFWVIKWLFPINIIFLAIGVRGISDSVRAIKYMFRGSNSKN